MANKNFPLLSSDNSKELLAATTYKGDIGEAAIVAIPQPWHLALPCDADGSNVDYSNKEIEVIVIEGNSIISSTGTPDGWTMTVDSVSNCAVTVSSLTASVNVISANHAYAVLKLSKVGYNDLYIKVLVSKINKGDQGVQGTQGVKGDKGDTGATGPSGTDATGFVIKKYVITVQAPDNPVISNNSGKVRLTYSSAHSLEYGERLHVFNATSYDSICTVTSIVSTVIVDTDLAYSAVETVDVRKMRQLCMNDNYSKYNSAIYQNLEFPNILPIGSKPYEIFLQKTSGTFVGISINIGNAAYPAGGFNSFDANSMIPLNNSSIAVDLWDNTRTDYKRSYIYEESDIMRNVYVYMRLYSTSQDWNDDVADNQFNLIVVYKFYDSDYTP